MIRRAQLLRASPFAAIALAGALAALPAVALSPSPDKLARYESERVPSSKKGVAFAIGYPEGWIAIWGGERTRFYPPEAEGPRLSLTFVHVDAIGRDDGGAEALLNEEDGLEKWVAATRPRYEFEDRRRVKVGAKGEGRDAILLKDPAVRGMPDRRELMVLVPAGDVNFVLRCSAAVAEYGAREPLFRQILESFEALGG